MATVLIGFAEALAAPEAAWSLRDAGHRVVAFTRRGRRPALRRQRGIRLLEVTPPEQDAAAALQEVVTAARGADVVLPLDDAAAWLTGRAAEAVEAVVAGPTGEQLDFAMDKRLQIDAARSVGLPVPDGDGLPAIVKPALAMQCVDGRLLRGKARVCSDPDELARALAAAGEREPVLRQPLLRGTGEGLFGLATARGVVGWSAHRRVRMMNPQGSGSSACAPIPIEASLQAATERLLRAAGWRGLFMAEFLRDGEGRPWFMELNGRCWGSLALGRRLGAEYPAWAVEAALDPAAPPPAPARDGAIVCRHAGREIVHLMMVLRGPRSSALADAWPGRAATVRALLSLRAQDRWYNWRADEPGVFLQDTIQTVWTAVRGS